MLHSWTHGLLKAAEDHPRVMMWQVRCQRKFWKHTWSKKYKKLLSRFHQLNHTYCWTYSLRERGKNLTVQKFIPADSTQFFLSFWIFLSFTLTYFFTLNNIFIHVPSFLFFRFEFLLALVFLFCLVFAFFLNFFLCFTLILHTLYFEWCINFCPFFFVCLFVCVFVCIINFFPSSLV